VKAGPTAVTESTAALQTPVVTSAPAQSSTRLVRFTQEHLKRLEGIAQNSGRSVVDRRQRDFAVQRVLRELEQSIRAGVLNFCHQAAEEGISRQQLSVRLSLSPRTLRHWQKVRRDGLAVQARGRRLACSGRHQQQAVVHLLHRLGPGTGLAVLEGQFPGIARAELRDLLRCFRWAWIGEHRRWIHVLHWQRPGGIWAMDHAVAPCWIDGDGRDILAVRDLASGQQLLWLPVGEATAARTLQQLVWLFACYGAPLVLKSDNGSAFSADDMGRFLRQHGVWPLFSPPRTPAYNGACEAAIGSMKNRTAYQAERHRRTDGWTSKDLEVARQLANETARPRGPKGWTPAEAWERREAITVAERRAFADTVTRLESEVRRRRDLPLDVKLDRRTETEVQREALRRALVAHNYLLFTRRRIPIPIRSQKAAKIR
jgi:transposase InsO family protein